MITKRPHPPFEGTDVGTLEVAVQQSLPARPLDIGSAPLPMDASDLIVAYLESLGVEHVFGVPGGAVEPLYNALARSQRRGGPRPVTARHEAGAAFMADGYARETGKLGVCIATSGPGATNLITGIACSYENNIPVLAITGQPALPSFGRRALQESSCTGVNVVGMFRHCTRYDSLVSHIDQLENKLASALMRAYQSPQGPAHLSIPVDLLRSPVAHTAPSFDLATLLGQRPSMVDEAAIRKLGTELESAQRPVFLIGGGCGVGEASQAIIRLAELTGALFITTPDGKGFIDPHHPAYRGVFGLGGHQEARALLAGEPDLIVAFGTAFGELSSNGWSDTVLNQRLIHIDESHENLMRSPMARLHVCGRIVTTCQRLIELLPDPVVSLPTAATMDPRAASPEECQPLSDETPIKPQRLMHELSRRCPSGTRFIADAGNSFMWAVHCLTPPDRRSNTDNDGHIGAPGTVGSRLASWLRVTMDFAPMGWAIGCAVGVARGNPGRPVVCITGDGSYLMSGQEITVALEEELPVIFVVLNDSAYGMVMHGQRLAGAEPIAFNLPKIDYRSIAVAMGIPGYVAASPRELQDLDFDEIMSRKGPTLLDIRIDREEVPPMALRLKTLGSIQ